MKIFYVTADFELSERPAWLDAFRATYDDPYPYHITLKQGTYFEENRLAEIEEVVKKIATSTPPVQVIFNKLRIHKTPKGHVIMIWAQPNVPLVALQKELRERLSPFGEIIEPHYKEYETNFEPHITIARHLTDEQLEEARKDIGSNTACSADITSITLKTNSTNTHVHPDYTITFSLMV